MRMLFVPPSQKASSVFKMDSNTFVRVEPEKTDRIAGGASFPPRRQEFPSEHTDAIRRCPCSANALSTLL